MNRTIFSRMNPTRGLDGRGGFRNRHRPDFPPMKRINHYNSWPHSCDVAQPRTLAPLADELPRDVARRAPICDLSHLPLSIQRTAGGTGAPHPVRRPATSQDRQQVTYWPLCGATVPCDGKAGADRDVACDELRAGARHGLRSGSSETAVGRSGATVGRDGRPGLFMSVRNKTMGQGMDSTSWGAHDGLVPYVPGVAIPMRG